MASNKLIEDALTKQVSESAVSAIVGSLESHLASATSQADIVRESSDPSGRVANVVNSLSVPGTTVVVGNSTGPGLANHEGVPRPITNASQQQPISRARANGPTTNLVRTGPPQAQVIQTLPIRPPNVQLVTVQNSTLATGIRGRGVTTNMLPNTATQNANMNSTGNAVGMPRPLGAPPPAPTLVIGTNQINSVRVSQPTLVQSNQPIPGMPGGPNGQHILIKTEAGYQLVRLDPRATLNATAPQGAVQVPVPMQSATNYRFQSVQQIRTGVSTNVAQPGMVRNVPSNQSTTLPSRSPAPVAVIQPGAHLASSPTSNGPPPLVQQHRPPSQQQPAPLAAPPGAVVVSGPITSVASSIAASAAHRPPTSAPGTNTQGSQPSNPSSQMPPETAKIKCKNFLATLLRLANEQPETVARNVRNLIQGLVAGRVIPEDFTAKLQRELNSSPQPCLVPFLKKSLPYLRASLAVGELSIDGVVPPPLSSVTVPSSVTSTTITNATASGGSQQRLLGPTSRPPTPQQQQQQPVRMQTPRGPVQNQGIRMPTSVQQIQGQRPPGQQSMESLNHTLSYNQYPSGLKIITPTPFQGQNSVNAQAGSSVPVTAAATASETSVSTAPVPSPTQTGSASKNKSKSKTSTTTTNGVPSPGSVAKSASTKNASNSQTKPNGVNGVTVRPLVTKPASSKSGKSSSSSGSSSSHSSSMASGGMSMARNEVDDINDVAAMGGVNLQEESQRIMGSTEFIGTVARSCPDEMKLDSEALGNKVAEVCRAKGLDHTAVAPEVLMLIAHATEEMVKSQLSKLSHAAQHRMDVFKFNSLYEQCADVRGQIRFLENVERGEKRRHEELEREMLIKAAKSRAKVEDPERAKLREKAKELQRAEQEEIRQREANMTALQAIGQRKKFKADGGSSGSSSMQSMMSFRPRVKRVNLKDMAFVWENDRNHVRGHELYKLFLK